MNNFYKKAAAREGFTLVELIVVIAILAILAAVAYPAYTGYITKANEAADIVQLDGIKTAAQAAAAESGAVTEIKVDVAQSTGKVSDVTITTDGKDTKGETIKITGNTDDTFKTLLGTELTSITFKSNTYKNATAITWTPYDSTKADSGEWKVGS